jgi:hypothetical protein
MWQYIIMILQMHKIKHLIYDILQNYSQFNFIV